LSSSCSLLHVPYTVQHETKLDETYIRHFASAEEKLSALSELGRLAGQPDADAAAELLRNDALFRGERYTRNEAVRERTAALTEADFIRLPAAAERAISQEAKLGLPLLPTTTIGSFPQTADVRANRA